MVSLGTMTVYTTTGAIDSCTSDAAMSINATASTFTSLPLVLIVTAVVAIIAMISMSRRAF